MTHKVLVFDEDQRMKSRQPGWKRDPHMAADEIPKRPSFINDEMEAVMIRYIEKRLREEEAESASRSFCHTNVRSLF